MRFLAERLDQLEIVQVTDDGFDTEVLEELRFGLGADHGGDLEFIDPWVFEETVEGRATDVAWYK